MGQLYTDDTNDDTKDNDNNDDNDANDDNNDTRWKNHDCIGSLAKWAKNPKENKDITIYIIPEML